jgi:AraC-like DNA-binding protein
VAERGARLRDDATAIGRRVLLVSFQAFDPDLLDSSGLIGDRPRHSQIGRGPLQGQINQLYFEQCAIRTGAVSQTLQATVQLPSDRMTFGIALDSANPVQVLGRSFEATDVTVFGAGEAIDVVFNAGSRWATFNLPVTDYENELAVTANFARLQRPQAAPRFRASALPFDRLRNTIAAIESVAQSRPELFDDGIWRANAEKDLKNGFFGLLESAALSEQKKGEARLRSARTIVREAEARLGEDEMAVPSIVTLCKELRVPRRTLERAFREAVGLSPADYFRIRALNAVRRQLLGAAPQPGVIARIAIDNGFWHLGRFSGAYRTLFGERPIDTLRNRDSTRRGR